MRFRGGIDNVIGIEDANEDSSESLRELWKSSVVWR